MKTTKRWSIHFITLSLKNKLLNTCEGTLFGGSILMVGSHSPGGSTVTQSRNSSMPARRSYRSRALYATSWKTYKCRSIAHVIIDNIMSLRYLHNMNTACASSSLDQSTVNQSMSLFFSGHKRRNTIKMSKATRHDMIYKVDIDSNRWRYWLKYTIPQGKVIRNPYLGPDYYQKFTSFCRAMLCKRGLSRHALSVRLSVCPSVTYVHSVETNKHIF